MLGFFFFFRFFLLGFSFPLISVHWFNQTIHTNCAATKVKVKSYGKLPTVIMFIMLKSCNINCLRVLAAMLY